MSKIILVTLTILIILASSCAMLYDKWPAKIPADNIGYLDKDPNTVGKPWPSLGELKDLKEEAVTHHILTQIDLKYAMEKDKAHYDRAIQQADMNIQIAEQERASTIGTIQNPGWLMGALIGLTGLGAYLTGARTQRPEDWTEAEHQEAIKKAVEEAVKS
jgi:hypothetical protein